MINFNYENFSSRDLTAWFTCTEWALIVHASFTEVSRNWHSTKIKLLRNINNSFYCLCHPYSSKSHVHFLNIYSTAVVFLKGSVEVWSTMTGNLLHSLRAPLHWQYSKFASKHFYCAIIRTKQETTLANRILKHKCFDKGSLSWHVNCFSFHICCLTCWLFSKHFHHPIFILMIIIGHGFTQLLHLSACPIVDSHKVQK